MIAKARSNGSAMPAGRALAAGRRRRAAARRVFAGRSWAERAAGAVDLAIFQVFPRWGSRRMALRRLVRLARLREEALMRHFAGAESDRITSGRWLTSRLSPDSGLEYDLETLRERCEELYRSDPIAHSAVEGRVANEIGTGLWPQAAIAPSEDLDEDAAKQIATRLEGVGRRWSEAGVDRSGRESLVQVEKLAQRTFAVCGEVFVELADRGAADKPIPLTLDVIHPSRIATPGAEAANPHIRMGIEYDDAGQVVAYWKRRTHPHDSRENDPTYDRIPAKDEGGQLRMLHVFDPMFAGQSRGIPWMAAALERIKDASDVVDYEIIAKQVEACFTAFVSGGQAAPVDVAEATSTDTDSDGNRTEELRPGMIEYLAEGQEINFAAPQRPGATFFPLVEHALRTIAGALSYPYELLANNFFRTTFSAGRLAMLAGRVGFRMRRRVLVEKLLTPVWRRIVYEAFLVGELDSLASTADYVADPARWSDVRWQEPGWSYIDPEKEVKANTLGVREDLNTMANVIGEQGGDLDTHLDQRFKEKAALVRQRVALRVLQRQLEEQAALEPEPAGETASDAASDRLAALDARVDRLEETYEEEAAAA